MKPQSRMIRTLLTVSLLFFASTMHALTEESVSQKPQISQENKSEKLGEETLKKVYTYINQIACIFGDLATLVQEDAIKTNDKEAKLALNQAIIGTRKIITSITHDLDNSPTLSQLHTTIELLNKVVSHLEGYLKGDFTTYKVFDLEANRTRLKVIDSTMLTEESLNKNLTDAQDNLKTIQKKADDTGLYWFNHLYRKTFDRFVVRPCDKYNLHWKALYATAALAGTAYLWYKINTSTHGLTPEQKGLTPEHDIEMQVITHSYVPGDHSLKGYLGRAHDTINYYIRSFLGSKPDQDVNSREGVLQNALLGEIEKYETQANIFKKQGDPVASEACIKAAEKLHRLFEIKRPVKLFGVLEKSAFDALHGHWYLGSALLWEPFRTGLADTFTKYSSKLKTKLLGVHNWLKGGAYYQRHKNKKGVLGRTEPRYTYDDIIGLDNAKNVLKNVVEYMKNPEGFDRAGLTPGKGFLLIGPSRTGKTMLAEATAGEIKKALGSDKELPFYSIEARWIAAEGNFDWLMRIVKENAPCIIFIDEIDMLNLHRDKFTDKTVLLSEFLSTLSGCMNDAAPDKQVIIIAATNKPENLDGSLKTRLSIEIPFEYPSFLNRAEFFMNTLESKGLPIEQFDIKKLAEQTEGCSFEQLHKVINNTQFITREQGRPITQADLEKGLNTELHGIIYHNYIELPEEDQQILAVHMAGHAIAYSVTEGTGVMMSQVTIRPVKSKIEKESVLAECLKDVTLPNIMYGHVFTHYKADSLKFISQKEIERLCMIELAGHIAEKLILGSHHSAKNTCSHHDTTKAFYWARKYQLNGLDEQLIAKSNTIQDQITKDAYAFMQQCEDKMRALLETRVELIKLVAEGLKGFGTVGGEDMQTLIDIHTMLNGKTIEEFVKEMQEAEQASGEDEATETRNAVRDELGIDELTAAA